MVVIISGVALLAASLIYIAIGVNTYKNNLIERTVVLSDFIGANSSAALMFDDAEAAGNLLEALRSEESIMQAVIYQEGSQVFSSYTRNDDLSMEYPDDNWFRHSSTYANGKYKYAFSDNRFSLVTPIIFSNDTLGHVRITSSMKPLYKSVSKFLVIIVILFTVIMAGVYFRY